MMSSPAVASTPPAPFSAGVTVSLPVVPRMKAMHVSNQERKLQAWLTAWPPYYFNIVTKC
jgi:hypothetical protein